VLDLSGLAVQGVLVPVAQIVAVGAVLAWAAPAWRGALALSWPAAFLLNFVLVDYAYYWNHRLLHARPFWRWHAVHHTAPAMDVLVTSRNTLWSHALVLYLWVNGALAYLLADPTPYLAAAALTAALDLWRHSPWTPRPGSPAWRALAAALVTPHEHAWHHSTARPGCNFGANLRWWDRLHGTAWSPAAPPAALGLDAGGTAWQRLLWPARPEAA
jgi:sterol desaturase/sphingolipid hydroxylase (fatty acid hydroxylase superfamily)